MRTTFGLTGIALLLCGCGAYTTPVDMKTDYASYVGDARTVLFTDIVATVALNGSPTQYANVHVGLAALVNPKKVGFFQNSSNDYDTEWIVGKCKARVAAAVVQEIQSRESINISGLGEWRQTLQAKAQETFDAVFAKWEDADDYTVQIVVTSFYLTSGDGGP